MNFCKHQVRCGGPDIDTDRNQFNIIRSPDHIGNCLLIFCEMTKPINRAENLGRFGNLPEDREARIAVMQRLLKRGAATMDSSNRRP